MSSLRKFLARTYENVRLAIAAIWVNRIRAFITMFIIALGLLALMGMVTVLSNASNTIENEIANENGAQFEITSWAGNIQIGGNRIQLGEDYSYISRWQAARFCKEFAPYGGAAYTAWVTSTRLKYRDKESRPSLSVWGINEHFLLVNNKSIAYGRGFIVHDFEQLTDIVIIGYKLATQLFDKAPQALGKRLMIGSAPFTVVGVLAERSSTFGGTSNEEVYVPIHTGLARFPIYETDCQLSIAAPKGADLNEVKSNAEMVMRSVRGLRPIQRNTFNITTNDEILNMILNSLSSIAIAAILIGIITLIGSAIGLMNIMLASVTERTREIGTRKAIGAYSSTIRGQFLLEAIFITVFGGLIGILLGLLVGKLLAIAMGGSFVIPWGWTLGSLCLCIIVGVFAGYLPASRAARLDPIDALRYE